MNILYKAYVLNQHTKICELHQKINDKWIRVGNYPIDLIVEKIPGCIIN